MTFSERECHFRASRSEAGELSGTALRIATRLEFVTLDELESGFCDRLSDSALFLSRALLGKTPDELYVGAPVVIDIETASGQRALSVEGVVAWSYPPHPHTPPGREPGAGIAIDRHADEDSKARATRMLKRPGAGGRVRAPGTRLPPPKLTPSTSGGFVPRAVSGKFTVAPGPASSPSSTPPASSSASSSPPPSSAASSSPPAAAASGALPSTAPPSTASAPDAPAAPSNEPATPLLPSTLLAPPGEAAEGLRVDQATGELVVPFPPAPQPRVMAVDMFVDQRMDLTPAPAPAPPEPAVDEAATEPPAYAEARLPALPFAGLLALEPPAGVDDALLEPPPARDAITESALSPVSLAADEPTVDGPTVDGPRPISLDGLPDVVAAPPHAFEARSTDVDLLVSLDDGDFFPAELEEQRAKARAALNAVTRAAKPDEPVVNPALVEETVTSWNQLDDLPSADNEAELLSAADVEPIGDEATGSHDTHDSASLPSLDSAEIQSQLPQDPAVDAPSDPASDARTAEHTAVNLPRSSVPSHEETRELELRTDRGAAVRSTAESALDQPTAEGIEPEQLPLRPLPELPLEEPDGPGSPLLSGTAFLYSLRRGGDGVHGIEPFAWPRHGTKRWNAMDAAREEGNEAAMDAAVSSSAWLSRDPSSSEGASEPFRSPSLTDPGVRVADVVTKAVALAAEEDDGNVFSDSGAAAPVRPAMAKADADEADQTVALDDGETTAGDATSDDPFAPAAGGVGAASASLRPDAGIDDEAETDRTLQRPPSKASAEAQARLGVLQRFLGRR